MTPPSDPMSSIEPLAAPSSQNDFAAMIPATAVRRSPGLCVFFSGLSGSGKTTVSEALRAVLTATGIPITMLDGDIVRAHLSAGLGFSHEDRDLNIQRIAFVAAEVTRHGGIAICAPIAPYDAARRRARAMVVEAGGHFILVHLSTPLDVCEARDPKGLYARARAGELSHFTGIDDPYEPPIDADVTLDTSRSTVDECTDVLLAHIGELRDLTGALAGT